MQKVFFRKETKKEADRLGVSGHVRNTLEGTVVGEVYGSDSACKEMREWLWAGPPKAHVEDVVFSDERVNIAQLAVTDFKIVK